MPEVGPSRQNQEAIPNLRGAQRSNRCLIFPHTQCARMLFAIRIVLIWYQFTTDFRRLQSHLPLRWTKTWDSQKSTHLHISDHACAAQPHSNLESRLLVNLQFWSSAATDPKPATALRPVCSSDNAATFQQSNNVCWTKLMVMELYIIRHGECKKSGTD